MDYCSPARLHVTFLHAACVALMIVLSAATARTATAQDAAASPPADAPLDAKLTTALEQLASSSFKDKEAGVARLAQIRNDGTRAVLNAMLEGNLYYRREDKHVFIAKVDDTTLTLTDAATARPAGTANSEDFSKITTNNSLRKVLKSSLASFSLSDPDAAVRLGAVNEMLRSMDADNAAILREQWKS